MSKKKLYPLRLPKGANGIRLNESRSSSRAKKSRSMIKWLDTLMSFDLAGRFGRGRSYALSRQVLGVEIASGKATGIIQGARDKPYKTIITFRTPSGQVRKRILERLRTEPVIAARLLNNDFPEKLETIFREEGFAFFPVPGKMPDGAFDIAIDCSCPDYAGVCKHAIALLYILGEEVSARPATLLTLRGFTIDELF